MVIYGYGHVNTYEQNERARYAFLVEGLMKGIFLLIKLVVRVLNVRNIIFWWELKLVQVC